MKNYKLKTKNLILFILLLFTFHFSFFTANAQIAVKGETIWTMAGEPLTNGVVLIKDGKIEAVGTAAQVKIPSNYRAFALRRSSFPRPSRKFCDTARLFSG